VARTFYEFFAGGGMVRLSLGPDWTCLFANDFDAKKAASYRANFDGAPELRVEDIAKLTTRDLPGRADLAWASFPCQDLSLAGNGKGLKGARSGMFWAFWRLMQGLRTEGRAPKIICLENVYGLLTSHGGADFRAICEALTGGGYRVGAMLIDAAHFVPQSRLRLFIVAVRSDVSSPLRLGSHEPDPLFHPNALTDAHDALSASTKINWVWWRLSAPPARNIAFADIVEDAPTGVAWHSKTETERLLGMMSPANLAKVHAAQSKRRRVVGSLYKRTRREDGVKHQRAEVRFDDISGCLRTPGGGSSRQTIMLVHGDKIRSRLLSPREAARLMGLPEDYVLPERYNDAYRLAGDGVAVPIVRHLAENLFEAVLPSGHFGATRQDTGEGKQGVRHAA
jgi:DNA (cytosine-5)-methyltransferase 1